MSKRNSSRSGDAYNRSRNKNKNEKICNYGCRRSMTVRPSFQTGLQLTNPLVVSPLKKTICNKTVASSNKTKTGAVESLRNTQPLRPSFKRSNSEYIRTKTSHKNTLDSEMPYLRSTSTDGRIKNSKHIYPDSWQEKGLCERHAKLINSNVTPSSSNVILDDMCPVCQDVSKIMMLKSKDIYPYAVLNNNMVQEERKRVDKEFTTSILNQGNDLLLRSSRNSEEKNENEVETDTMAEVTAFLNKHVARLNEEKKVTEPEPETEKPAVTNVHVLTSAEPAKTDIKVQEVEKPNEETKTLNPLPVMETKNKEDLVGCGKKLKEMMEKHRDLLNKLKDYETQNKVIQDRLNHFDKLKNSLIAKQTISAIKEEEEGEEDIQEDIDTMIIDYLTGKRRDMGNR